jgi:cytochrome P450
VSTTDAEHRSPTLLTFVDFYSWRRMRRAAHEALTKVAVQRYYPIQTKEATILVSALLVSPENREQHIQRAAASAIMSILYDYPTLASGQDKAVQDMDRMVQWAVRAATGTSLVEFFPWMIHIPQRSGLSQFQNRIYI